MTTTLLCIAAYLFIGYWAGFAMYRYYRGHDDQKEVTFLTMFTWPVMAIFFIPALMIKKVYASYDWLERKLKRRFGRRNEHNPCYQKH